MFGRCCRSCQSSCHRCWKERGGHCLRCSCRRGLCFAAVFDCVSFACPSAAVAVAVAVGPGRGRKDETGTRAVGRSRGRGVRQDAVLFAGRSLRSEGGGPRRAASPVCCVSVNGMVSLCGRPSCKGSRFRPKVRESELASRCRCVGSRMRSGDRGCGRSLRLFVCLCPRWSFLFSSSALRLVFAE